MREIKRTLETLSNNSLEQISTDTTKEPFGSFNLACSTSHRTYEF